MPLTKSFGVSKLPSKRHALLTGSRALIKRIGKSSVPEKIEDDTSLPLCYLLDEPIRLEDVTIKNTDGMSNHVLVCLHREVINMFKFIYNLRSPIIKAEELQDIVLLCSKEPSPKIFELINTFPKVYFMEVYILKKKCRKTIVIYMKIHRAIVDIQMIFLEQALKELSKLL